MIEKDIKLLEHCVLDLQHRVQALEAQVKALQRRVLKLELQADRKTENSSEKPNNCETCKHYKLTCDLFSEICKYEPKDEPQTERSSE